MPVRYDQDIKAKAIRLVREHAGDYPPEYAAITAVAQRLGMTPETLRKWIRQAAVDEGQAPGVNTESAREIRELKRKVPIAPRTYWARRSRPPSRRALKGEALTEILAGIYEPDEDGRRPPECLYGSVKMWEHLNRQGVTVAKCTVERLMRARGWRGVTRGRTVRTTIPDPGHSRAPDLVRRHFTAEAPGQLHVAGFTCVPLDGGGFGYAAFVIGAFAGLITGWECSLSKETGFVERAVRQAAAWRARQGHPLGKGAVRHSGAGSQYTSARFAQALLLAGLTPSAGTAGDALGNALAETAIGLYKTGCTRPGSPFRDGPIRSLADLEEITSAWVHWYNTARLMHRLGRRPPAEAGAGYCQQAKDAA